MNRIEKLNTLRICAVPLCLSALAVLLLAGCHQPPPPPERICPGAKNLPELHQLLSRRWNNICSFRATGKSRLLYHDVDGKSHKEEFPIRLWVRPPDEICLHGDVAFNAKGIVFGSNPAHFWLVTRPKEIRGYWWGPWHTDTGRPLTETCLAALPLAATPRTLLEALGLIKLDEPLARYSLSHKGPHDIITLRNRRNQPLKKYYINSCDLLYRRIEYFDYSGKLMAAADLARYKPVASGFLIPGSIIISRNLPDGTTDRLVITVNSVRPADFSDVQQEILFTRPDTEPFDEVYRLTENCEFVEDNPS